MSDFVHLHVHSEFSLLDGLCKIPQLVKKAKEHGQKALALTDHGAMYGMIQFYNTCKAEGIKPIIGAELYLAQNSRFDKQSRMGADQFHLTLLAKNQQGYENLMQLVSIAYLEGFSYKPRIDFDILKKYHEGLVVTSGCNSGLIPKLLLANKPKEARGWAKKMLEVFGDDFYLEIQRHPNLHEVDKARDLLVSLSKELGISTVATNDVHYIEKDDASGQDALLAIQTRKTINDQNRLSMLDTPDFYLKSTPEMEADFQDYPDALKNTVKIADKCNVTIQIGKMIFPAYPLEAGQTPESALRDLSVKQATQRYSEVTQTIKDRLKYELDIICDKGYASYFLIVQDFVNWAKQHGIRVGPGRGSAAGSLVSFVLRITSIDPLVHNLPFERFMNPQRPSPPDIDIDIADVSRDEVIKYVAKKYGEDHVAQIITFGTMEARAAVRDIGRVLGMPFSEPDKIAKLIPPGYSLEEALTNIFELQEFYKDPRYKELLDLAKKVEGVARHASVHAAGAIIADKPLTHYTPIQRENRAGKIITQYDMYSLDLNISETAIGLLKIDFLGLRNLSTLGKAIQYVNEKQNLKVDLSSIPLDDAKVYTMLSQGFTTGIFQLESPGMRRVARSLKPTRFTDITAMVALYRPGPMELIDDFIAGKQNPKKIKYPHLDLKPVLEETYGIPVYQEQVLQIANVFAGYSLGEADILRRAIGKKKRSILEKEKARFIQGAQTKGYDKKKALEIWQFIDKFAGYGFGKAHSASYAMIAYQTAYMKANYPVEYMAALLTIESSSHSAGKEEKVAMAIEECKRMGIVVLPPHINHSQLEFSIEPHPKSLNQAAIRFGFSAIKNVGTVAVENIVSVRSKKPFGTLTDFFQRTDSRTVNKKVIDCLVRTGSFDQFGTRGAVLAGIDGLRDLALERNKKISSGQSGLFDNQQSSTVKTVDKLPQVPDLPRPEKLADEKKLLGVYLNGHPHDHLFQQASHLVDAKIADLDPQLHQMAVTIGGIITRVNVVLTKKSNAEMAFVTLEDSTASIDTVLFPKTYADYKSYLVVDQGVLITGKLDVREGKKSLVVTRLRSLSEAADKESGNVIKIPRGTSQTVLKQIGQLLKSNPGDRTVEIKIPQNSHFKTIKLPYTVNFTAVLQKQIDSLMAAK